MTGTRGCSGWVPGRAGRAPASRVRTPTAPGRWSSMLRDPPASRFARRLAAVGDPGRARPAVRGPVPSPRSSHDRRARIRAGRGVAGRSATGRPVGRAPRRVAGGAVARAGPDRLSDLDRVLARSRHPPTAHARQPPQRLRALLRGGCDERDPRHLPRWGRGAQGADRADLPDERRRRAQAVSRREGPRGRDPAPRAVRHPAEHGGGRRGSRRRAEAVRDRQRGL